MADPINYPKTIPIPLFTPARIGSLNLPNRLVRSATAERLADPVDGRPLPALNNLYETLSTGGVGLIITGHMYVHPSGKAHPEMTGVFSDNLIPHLAELADTVHRADGKIAAQINHGGMQCDPEVTHGTIAPSAINEPFLKQPAREITENEIETIIQAYGQAARRVKEAGFDGVQIHAAHGYLISQFLSPYTNRRNDHWGGDFPRRTRFLTRVCQAVREQVGTDFPVIIKLGMMDGRDGGLSSEEGAQIVARLESLGLDAVEISGGIGGKNLINVRKGIRSEKDEAYFLHLARLARPLTHLPILLVGGFRSKKVMENVLTEGHADFISLCRPLISEPNLPDLMRQGLKHKSRCISSNNCWAEGIGTGIACKCPFPSETKN